MKIIDAEELCCPIYSNLAYCVHIRCMAWQPTRLITDRPKSFIYDGVPYYENNETPTDTGYCRLIQRGKYE